MGGLLDFMKGANDAAASTLYGPVDLLSLALRKAGLPMPDDQNVPGSKAWMQSKGLLHEAPVNRASAAGQTLGLLSPIVAQAKAPQISAGLLRMIDNANAPGAMNAATRNQAGAIVYHGSPHKFDKFDSTKIGTGEGAQAYGHGLYLAENPKTAQSYADELSQVLKVDGKTVLDKNKLYPTGNWVIDTDLVAAGGDLSKASKDKLAEIRSLRVHDRTLPDIKETQRELAALRALRGRVDNRVSGNFYNVDLPDEHIAKMLDWDKPLGQQAPEVQKVVESFMTKRAAEAELQRQALNAQYPGRTTHPVLSKIANRQRTAMDYKGDAAVSALVQDLGGPAKAAEYLRAQGIPGIRYLDGGSRGAGAGSSNFVVFPGNEGLLSILERNGVPINGK